MEGQIYGQLVSAEAKAAENPNFINEQRVLYKAARAHAACNAIETQSDAEAAQAITKENVSSCAPFAPPMKFRGCRFHERHVCPCPSSISHEPVTDRPQTQTRSSSAWEAARPQVP